jgi:hypothetical protein
MNQNREEGYYWIKATGSQNELPHVAHWCDGYWWQPGNKDPLEGPVFVLSQRLVPPTVGIDATMMKMLTRIAWERRLYLGVSMLAQKVTGPETGRKDKMRALVDELHRRFVLAPNPTSEFIRPFDAPFDAGATLDADDACVFVAAAAMSVGIPCRLVGVRYGRSWTCWISYEVDADSSWETIDPLRQKKLAGREPDEQVIGPNPKEMT